MNSPLRYRHRIAPVIPARLPYREAQDELWYSTVKLLGEKIEIPKRQIGYVKRRCLDEIASEVSDDHQENPNIPNSFRFVFNRNERGQTLPISVPLTVGAPIPDVEGEVATVSHSVSYLLGKETKSVRWSERTKYLTVTLHNSSTYRVTTKQGISLLGRDNMKWCRSHPEEDLTPEVAQVWGLSELNSACTNHSSTKTYRTKNGRANWKSSDDWPIERIVIGDGKADRSGIVLEENVCYGSSNIHGGNESFHPIKFYTSKVRRLTQRQTQPVPSSDGSMGPKFMFSNISEVTVLDEIMSYCRRNVGKPLTIGGPGARSRIMNVRKYISRDHGRVFMAAEKGECMIASILNAIDRLCGTKWANYVRQKAQVQFMDGLGQANEWLKSLKCHVQLQLIPRQDRETYHRNPFRWIAKRRNGIYIYIARLENKTMQHCVVIDAIDGIVVDSFQRYP